MPGPPRRQPHEAPPVGGSGLVQLGRRRVLQLAGASALIGAGACFMPPDRRALPYNAPEPDVTVGSANHYATAWSVDGYGVGLVVTSWEGRPTKVDGNPSHPASLGASGPFEQALPMRLYDGERLQAPLRDGAIAGLGEYFDELSAHAHELARRQGEGLHLLVEPTSSPFLRHVRDRIRERFPKARFVPWHPLARTNVHAGAELAFGRSVESVRDFTRAKVVVSLGDDFLGEGPQRLTEARTLADARDPKGDMARLWAVGSTLDVTGLYADERVRLRPSELEPFARALLGALAREGVAALSWARELPLLSSQAQTLKHLAHDLARAGERGVVCAGRRASPTTVALAHAMNAALGSDGTIVRHYESTVDFDDASAGHLATLVDALQHGEVDTLISAAFDPLYTAPADLPLAAAMAKAKRVVHLAMHGFERTNRVARWVLPAATELESWGDVRALDGTTSLQQPLILPLFGGITEAALVSPLSGVAGDPYTLLKDFWRARHTSSDFDLEFDRWLRAGTIPGTTLTPIRPEIQAERIRDALAVAPPSPAPGLELEFLPSATTSDGRLAHNSWLQELPDPVTKQSWGNCARLSPATARRFGLHTRSGVRVELAGRSMELPVCVQPGQADDTVAIALGYGVPAPAPMSSAVVGASAYELRRAAALWHDSGAAVSSLGYDLPFQTTQLYPNQDGRPLAVVTTLDELRREGPKFLHDQRGPVEKLYDPFQYDTEEYAWAMGIDLNRCIGCSACVVACQSENNVPSVGPEELGRGREMLWLLVDRYYEGDESDPEIALQPRMCVHCEAAPCEYVCPVNATVHSSEGLNEMVYNRCVGTRFCSNNCPYKVRRFNWLGYTERFTSLDKLAMNPQVTVRGEGVMEKCSYCVQRIERARIEARVRGDKIDTNTLQTACSQACPTKAIVFGSLHQKDSEVAKRREDHRHYDLLHDLGTRPRTTYLARVRNPYEES